MNTESIKKGDRITFSAPTRYGARKATRVVKDVTHDHNVAVAFHGWSHFYVQPWEIIEHHPKEN
jgi:hypothetical protein